MRRLAAVAVAGGALALLGAPGGLAAGGTSIVGTWEQGLLTVKIAAAGPGSYIGRLAEPFSFESKLLASKTCKLPLNTIFWRLAGPRASVGYTGTALSSGGLCSLHWVKARWSLDELHDVLQYCTAQSVDGDILTGAADFAYLGAGCVELERAGVGAATGSGSSTTPAAGKAGATPGKVTKGSGASGGSPAELAALLGKWQTGIGTVELKTAPGGGFVGVVVASWPDMRCKFKAGETIWRFSGSGSGRYTGTVVAWDSSSAACKRLTATGAVWTITGKTGKLTYSVGSTGTEIPLQRAP